MNVQRILIVDDKPENLYLLRSLLEGSGVEVEEAAQGAEALAKARKRPPAAVIADILMPVMDGFALCREWVRDAQLQAIPFVFYTATYTDERDREFALGLGATRFLVKPQEPEQLLAVLRDVLQEGAAPGPAAEDASSPAPDAEEGRFLQQYNQALVRKLEAKMEQLERANLDLQRQLCDRRAAEERALLLQAQLAQAQKMESIGRLAGGVAHDFNNMLSVILGGTELILERVPRSDPLREDLQEILGAAQRAREVTRRLLAFARKQAVEPRVLDVNEAIEDLFKMLRSLLGESIDLAWLPGRGVGWVRIDPSQLDQILANLCVNARDAIADVGRITLETCRVVCGESERLRNPDAAPGEYVCLSVSDNGCGMDARVMSHLFEPFFTTKETGKGTGLGLATVYGIVRQNGGFVAVESAPGRGSAFKVHLPCHKEAANTESERGIVPVAGPVRGETILLVEDEPAILKLGQTMLQRLGYRVIAAASACEALERAAAAGAPVDLLLTDVVMPGMNGRDLADRLKAKHPALRVLFMSGYTPDAIAQHGVPGERGAFLQKPFSKADLAGKVRLALDGGALP